MSGLSSGLGSADDTPFMVSSIGLGPNVIKKVGFFIKLTLAEASLVLKASEHFLPPTSVGLGINTVASYKNLALERSVGG